MTKLVDLIGLHILIGFDTCIPRKKGLDDGICFILDGKKYQIYTDGADGYRSYLSELFEEDIECRNMIPSEPVLITESGNPCANGITMHSMNGKKIAEIYTNYSDRWYACAMCRWYPENLVSNANIQKVN